MCDYNIIENTSKTYYNGSKWNSKSCGEFTIIGKTDKYIMNKTKTKKTYCFYLCKFQDGTIVEARRYHIKTGYVRNPNSRSLYGVGYLGEEITVEDGNIKKEYVVWSEMIRRCYAPNAYKKFPAYVGVTVCNRWQCFKNFCEDIQFLNGYNEWKNGDIKYELDKDILCEKKNIAPKIYSPETCMFISKEYNISLATSKRNLTGLTYIGISPDDKEYEFTNQKAFAEMHNLNFSLVNTCIHDNRKQHKGWTFKVKE